LLSGFFRSLTTRKVGHPPELIATRRRFEVAALKTQLTSTSALPRERQAHRAAALARIIRE